MAESMNESGSFSDSNSSCEMIELQKPKKLELNLGSNTAKSGDNELKIATSPLIRKFTSTEHSAAMTMKVSPALDVRKPSPSPGSQG